MSIARTLKLSRLREEIDGEKDGEEEGNRKRNTRNTCTQREKRGRYKEREWNLHFFNLIVSVYSFKILYTDSFTFPF